MVKSPGKCIVKVENDGRVAQFNAVGLKQTT